MWRHKKITAAIVIAILAGAYFYFSSQDKKVSATIYTYGTAEKGMISQSVSGTGQVAASEEENVVSRVSGDVTMVDAVEGQRVNAGDALASLDPADAQAAYEVAQANLENAKQSLQKSQQDNSLSLSQAQDAAKTAGDSLQTSKENLSKTYEQAFNTIVAAFADLPAVMSGMNNIISGSNSTVVQSSGTYLNYYIDTLGLYGSSTAGLLDIGSNYTAAKNSYDQVLAEYKKTSRYSDPDTITKLVGDSYDVSKKISNAAKALIDLIQQYQDVAAKNGATAQSFSTTHLSDLNTYAGTVNADMVGLFSTQQSITGAIQGVDSAQSALDQKNQSLETLKDLTNPMSAQSAQLAVDQKETALADAAETLNYYTIKAPFSGLVTAVDVKKGDNVNSGAAIATIITEQQVATISLNEVDVSAVKTGQKATLTFDAASDLTLTGHVSEVDSVGAVSSGVVSYGVTVVFDTQDDRIKPGMSATAAIITNTKQDILLVPSSAVKSNAAGDYVLFPVQPVASDAVSGSSAEGQSTKQQTVTVGLSDGNNTEIVSGLSEGDTVVTKTSTQSVAAAQSSQNSSPNMFRFLGGGGPGGNQVRSSGSGSSGSGSSKSSSSSSSGSSNRSGGSSGSSGSTPNPPDMGPM